MKVVRRRALKFSDVGVGGVFSCGVRSFYMIKCQAAGKGADKAVCMESGELLTIRMGEPCELVYGVFYERGALPVYAYDEVPELEEEDD